MDLPVLGAAERAVNTHEITKTPSGNPPRWLLPGVLAVVAFLGFQTYRGLANIHNQLDQVAASMQQPQFMEKR